jgi:hypothetical protein
MAKNVLNRFGGEEALIASNIENTTTVNGLTATNLQGALDEVVALAKNVKVTSVTGGYNFTNAANTVTEVRYDVIDTTTSNPKLTITVGGTLVKTIQLNQNQISIDTTNVSDWSLTDNILTIKETDGDTVATIDFSKFVVSAVFNATDRSYAIQQNGSTVVQVPARFTVQSETFIAGAGQTEFYLENAYDSRPHEIPTISRNGIELATNAVTFSADDLATMIYVPASNGGLALIAGDRIKINYRVLA